MVSRVVVEQRGGVVRWWSGEVEWWCTEEWTREVVALYLDFGAAHDGWVGLLTLHDCSSIHSFPICRANKNYNHGNTATMTIITLCIKHQK